MLFTTVINIAHTLAYGFEQTIDRPIICDGKSNLVLLYEHELLFLTFNATDTGGTRL